jgi:hypothetical protein
LFEIKCSRIAQIVPVETSQKKGLSDADPKGLFDAVAVNNYGLLNAIKYLTDRPDIGSGQQHIQQHAV